ncbi:hypothetical protein T12_11639 [Trichinella patagoniensis]|uniref:Uncharacterized protein n=1 Tax=Trichinella patagoniensis TaxID=990121 RepID=A0A0V0W9Q9_9BILA|nr:hypothetical protein T12_11639 [Trichinella patagoniensis]
MTTSKIICGVFLPGDELLRVEELSISTGPHLIDDSWLEINV